MYLDIPSMYCDTIKSYAMKPLYRNLEDSLKIMQGNEVIQRSFNKCQKSLDFYAYNETSTNENEEKNGEENKDAEYNTYEELTEQVEWKNIFGEEKIVMQGRSIGGCLDVVREFFGTKYDHIKEYIHKYKKDGIIWFLESFEISTAELYRVLWQMKTAGYFENCKGIILGRPLFVREDYGISYIETSKEILEDLKVPVICDADIGHVAPQMAIVNGAILKITSEKGKGKIETYLK